MSQETQLEESVENFVDEVESELQDRKQDAVEQAREAQQETDTQTTQVMFETPPVAGGGVTEPALGSDKVRFELTRDMSSRDCFRVPMPNTNNITDSSHPLNRLLSLYNIEPENIADINGEKLPVVPKGDYDDPESLNYELDIPPVPTKPNMFLYKTRRLALRMKLIRKGVTPSVRTDMFGHIKNVDFNDRRGLPAMPKEAFDFHMHLRWESEKERFVPTKRGLALYYLSQAALAVAPLLAFGVGFLSIALTLMLTLVFGMINYNGIQIMGQKAIEYIKENYFPDS